MTNPGAGSARAVWGASPAGTTLASGAEPGTQVFFERVRARRAAHEMSWLSAIVPFRSFAAHRVLEVGCGAGYDAFEFCRHGAMYTGIDITPENIDRTRKHLGFYGFAPELVVADAQELPFADESFDVVYSNGVLHHTADIAQSLREACRVLVPGGRIWVVVYHRTSVFYWLTLFLEHYLLRREFRHFRSFKERVAAIEYTTSDAIPTVNTYSRSEVRQLLVASGFEVRHVRVRKLTTEDLPSIPGLRRLWPRFPASALDRVGRRFGWYVIATGQKPGR